MKARLKNSFRQLARLLAWPALLVAKPAPAPEGEASTEGEKETQILLGGQAVIEGVLMRAPRSYCVAVRTPSRGIIDDRGVLTSPADRWKGWKLPFLRGLGVLGQTLALGIRALRFSADAALEEEEKKEQKSGTAPASAQPPAPDKTEPVEAKPRAEKAAFPAWLMWLQVAISVVFFIVLYKFIPLVLATQAERMGWSGGWLQFNLIDGVVRLVLFLGFLILISLWGDIRRTFEYHGAEHMTVYAWEAQQPVKIEAVRRFPPEHPRCGTSFLVVVILISLFLYALIPVEGFLLRFGVRLALLPVIVAVSYEVIRAAGRKQGSWVWRAAVWPGMVVQRLITTKKPDDGQIEVAIAALEGALEVERERAGSGAATAN